MTTSEDQLFEPGGSAPMRQYCRQLWTMRHYGRAEARGRLEAGYAEASLGRLWLLIEPALFIAVYFALFGILLDAERGLDGADFLTYLAVGKISFGFMRRAITSAAGSLGGDVALRAPNSMPRAIYPVIALLKSEIAYRYEIVVMLVLAVLRGSPPQLSWLLVPILGFMAFLFSFGAGLILVRVVSNFGDVRSALPQVLLLIMYTSGVIFPVEQYVVGSANETLLLRIMAVNPFYALVKLNQWAVMDYQAPEMGWIVTSAVLWTLSLPVLGLAWFIRAERQYSSAIYSGS